MVSLQEHIDILRKLPIPQKRAVLTYLDQLYRDHHTRLPDKTSAFFDPDRTNSQPITFEQLLNLITEVK